MEGVFISVRDTLISSPGNNQGYVMIALTMPVHPSLHPTVIFYFIDISLNKSHRIDFRFVMFKLD